MTRDEAVQKQIDEIMDSFEFDRVLKIMKALQWMWGFGESEHYPDEWELRKSARERLREAAKNHGSSETGGFLARCYYGIDKDDSKPFVRLSLNFGLGTCNDGESYDS